VSARRRRPQPTRRMPDWEAFAVAAPGLESLVAAELAELGIGTAVIVDGGVEFPASDATLFRANLELRVASRILVRLASFRAVSFAELERRSRTIAWDRVMAPGTPVNLRVTCRKSRLYHSGAVAERLMRDLSDRMDAIGAVGGDADDEGGTGQLIVVRLDHDRCTVSADSSGAHLHQRGYRTAVTEAPMRETLAAAMVRASEWDLKSPFIDPFCGSGTIPIEAALRAARIPPGRQRRFRCEDWPGVDQGQWERVRTPARIAGKAGAGPVVAGTDRSGAALRAAEANAVRAGVADRLQLDRIRVQDLVPPEDAVVGWVVTNPPYGVRLADAAEAKRLLRDLGAVLRDRFPGWHVGILTTDPGVAKAVGFPMREVFQSTNGGLRVRFVRGQVPSRSGPSAM